MLVKNEEGFGSIYSSLKSLNQFYAMLVCRYAQYGDVSPKVDVYAFGVVLYELISAKEAIVKASASMAESKGLVAFVSLFDPSILPIV